jgi:hypothetical protein
MCAARAIQGGAPSRATTTWSALEGEKLIALSAAHPHQQLIDRHSMSQLISPSCAPNPSDQNRAKKLPPGAEEFVWFLKSYIATWAGRAGVL